MEELQQISGNGSLDTFSGFVTRKCRAYLVSDDATETLLDGHRDYGCNCYASGEHLYPENIIVEAWPNMLKWLDQVYFNPEFEEPEFFDREDSPS